MIRAETIHEIADWPSVLRRLGIDERFLRNRNGPCPACGGTDRFKFDNRWRKGNFYCRKCTGSGDGFTLLQKVHGWTFEESLREVAELLGVTEQTNGQAVQQRPAEPAEPEIAKPTARVRDLMRAATRLDLVGDVPAYLASRGLWPCPGTDLRAVALADYWSGRHKLGRWPALLAPVKDRDGDLVTAHVTYLSDGAKLELDGDPCRKILSRMTGRAGCSVRLGSPTGASLGIAEGIETALAAAKLHGDTVWSALNAGMLAKWQPPDGIGHVTIYPDRDDAGLEAAEHLADQLQDDGVAVSLRVPRGEANDWADAVKRA